MIFLVCLHEQLTSGQELKDVLGVYSTEEKAELARDRYEEQLQKLSVSDCLLIILIEEYSIDYIEEYMWG